jgi:HlyD family secretion protein
MREREVAALADPRGDIRLGAIVILLFFGIFLGWAALFRLDAAAYAHGTLEVSGQRQTVQHRDGGVIGAIHVRDGQRVQAGDLLIELSAPEVRAQERALQAQAIELLAQRARLNAEQLGRADIAPPVEFAALRDDDKVSARAALSRQTVELRQRRAVLAAQRDTFRQRVAQSGDQGRGFSDQVAATKEQIRLIDEQITALAPLAEKGFVSKTRVRELQRGRAQLLGMQGQYAASVAQSQGAASENHIQVLEAERGFQERAAAELREVENRLAEVLPKLGAAREQLARTEIRAPATGAVVGLTVFTPGGVVTPGQKLMDIVPEQRPLRVEARISPDDADDLTVGADTYVKFSGLHERSLPNLAGKLTRLSADNFTDEKSGASFYTGEVTVPASQIRLIRAVRGADFTLRAGMPVEILIPLRKRTALDYALEPLVGSFWSSFREH